MRNIRLFIEFPSNDKPEEHYAISFTGILTRKYVYAKRVSCAGNLDYVKYVKIARSATKDITSSVSSIWEVPHRSIDVFGALKDDNRIFINPEFPYDIAMAIDEAREAEKAAHKARF